MNCGLIFTFKPFKNFIFNLCSNEFNLCGYAQKLLCELGPGITNIPTAYLIRKFRENVRRNFIQSNHNRKYFATN